MRPGQQSKRMRGRGRRGPNPLSRSYESNGPDVKVRGTAAHIAEKYMQLARDAHASGDPVLAESYLQHAEHYFRIIAAAQSQQTGDGQPQPQRYNGGGRFDSAEDEGDDSDGQDGQDVQQSASEPPAAAKPAEEAAPEAEAQQKQAEQPAPRRRRRRSNPDQSASAGNGADPEARAANGQGGDSKAEAGHEQGNSSKEDVDA